MFVIRVFLAIAFFPAFLGLIRLSNAKSRALRILMLLLLLLATFSFLIVPGVWDKVADYIGINSGLDLLVYATILSMLTYIAYAMNKFRDAERRLTIVARELALLRELVEKQKSC